MTKLIEIPRPPNPRLNLIDNAKSIIGIGAQNNRTEFLNLLGPGIHDSDISRPFKIIHQNNKIITQGISTCALVIRGLWRRMNIDMPEIYQKYMSGTVISAEIKFAQKYNAYQPYIKGLLPELGDYLIIGTGLSTHVLTPIAYDGDYLISVDGGQVDNNNLQCVKQCKRLLIEKGKDLYLDKRKILGWISFDMLPHKNNTILVPYSELSSIV